MTIEIIKPGKLPEEEKYTCTCTNCGCIFTCQRKDGKYISAQRDGDFLEVDCPTCHKRAIGYPGTGGKLIPRRLWNDGLASQIEAVESGRIVER